MAGEAKYHGLPCIDTDGRDVFESGDNFADSNDNDNDELKSDAVDHFNVNQKQAISLFHDKYVDSSSLDFSDRIGPHARSGYESKSVYEIIGEQVAKETPQQKYQRLQHELQELAEEVDQIKGTITSADQEAKTSPVALSGEVRQLQQQLQDLHLEKILGTENLSGDAGIPGSWTRQIISHLNTFKSKDSGKEVADKDRVIYELHYKPEHAKFAKTAKMSELEQRLKCLEDVIGQDHQKMATIVAEPDTGEEKLMDVVAILRAKLSLLDPANVDVVDARLQGLLQHIIMVGAKKEAVENAERNAKISELYGIAQKWDGMADLAPELAERLKALTSLHEQASTFAQTLAHLETTQSQIKDQLHSQNGMLSQLEKNFVENATGIQTNCASLDGRITVLLDKMG